MTSDSKAVCGGGEVNEGVLRQADACLLELAAQANVSRRDGLTATANALEGCAFVMKRLRNFADAALASTAGAGAGDWVPIEMAPKDGTQVLVIRQSESGKRYVEISAWRRDTYGHYHWSLNGDYQRSWHPAVAWQPMPAVEVQSPAVPASARSGAGEGEVSVPSQAQILELLALAHWLRADGSANDAANVEAAVSALSQGGGAGRSERAVEIRELSKLADDFEQSGKTLFHPEQFPPGYVQAWEEAHRYCARDLRTLVASFASGSAGLVSAADPAQSPSTLDREIAVAWATECVRELRKLAIQSRGRAEEADEIELLTKRLEGLALETVTADKHPLHVNIVVRQDGSTGCRLSFEKNVQFSEHEALARSALAALNDGLLNGCATPARSPSTSEAEG